MSTTSPQPVTQLPPRTSTGIFSSPTSGGSWPTTDRERATSELKANLNSADRQQQRITFHSVSRAITQRSTGLSGYLTVHENSESAQNGDTKSRLYKIFLQTINSYAPRCALGTIIMKNSSSSLPGLSAFALAIPKGAKVRDFKPDVEVKSKMKRDGRAVWKQIRGIIDTGCDSGNWVSAQFAHRLGIMGKLLDLTPEEASGSQSATGQEFRARGAVVLTWRGIPGGGLPNCSKTFKMRFLVSAVEEPPYDFLVGAESICNFGILLAPILVVHNIPTLPRRGGANTQAQEKETIQERRERSRRELEESAAPQAPSQTVDPSSSKNTTQSPAQQIEQPPTPIDSRTPSINSTHSKSRANSNGPVAVKEEVKNCTPAKPPAKLQKPKKLFGII